MKAGRVLKKKVLEEIEKLPDDHLREIRDYVDNLLKTKRRTKEAAHSRLDKDPIVELFGVADVEPFSHKIDSDVYGD